MNSVYASLKNRGAARRGTSLIEILVVLVILVFGILSVIRLFPAGFLVFRSAQNNGVGQRIGQGELESISKDTSTIADGVYVYNDTFGFDPTMAPGDLTGFKADPANAALFTDINAARYVSNETLTVPPARVVTPVSGSYQSSSVYVLNYGPAIVHPAVGINVIGAPWTGQIANSAPIGDPNGPTVDEPADFLSPGQQRYLIDYNNHEVAIPVEAYSRGCSFSVMTNLGMGYAFVSELPASGGTWRPVGLLNSQGVAIPQTAIWTPGTAVLYRSFTELPSGQQIGPNWSNDPYEFRMRYDSIGPHDTNVGVVDFNPLAGGGNSSTPLKARISYVVYNWHILHEDHTLPYKSEDRTIRLGIDNLKKAGDVQNDQTLFKGLFDSTTAGQMSDIMICNLDTGNSARYDSIDPVKDHGYDLDAVDAGNKPTDAIGISYKSGRITFPQKGSPDPVYDAVNPSPNSNGVHLRIYYMGSADWGVALQKAPAQYLPTANNLDLVTNSVSPPNLYYVAASAPGGALRVYFPNCDYGKTVEISGVLTYTVGGKLATMAIPTVTSAINNPDRISGKDVGYIDIGAAPASYDANVPMSVSSVRGVSANALVVWRENDQWKSRIVDTLLPRN